jgi:hypothetical protein
MQAMNEVVPFGKYKDQPVEVLAADRDYARWLTSQPWFRERYGNVYNILIQGGVEPQDTPEHNEMQARFLDDNWCRGLALALSSDGLGHDSQAVTYRHFESRGWDVVFTVVVRGQEAKDTYRGGWELHREWEPCDVPIGVAAELKPDLGDDYPEVLRQVKRRSSTYTPDKRCVVARRHEFERVDWEQVRQIFASSGIVLLKESDIHPPVESPWVND